MATAPKKRQEPRVLGPFEAATPPDTSEDEAVVQRNIERLNRVRQSDMMRDRTPSPEMQRKLQQQAEEEKMQRDMNRAAREAPARSMGTFDPTTRYAKGGSVSSASKRADGCAVKGKTRGKFV